MTPRPVLTDPAPEMPAPQAAVLVAAFTPLAAPWYDPALPYHNVRHAAAVTDGALRLLGEVRDHNAAAAARVDVPVLIVAALFHDAGYRTCPATVGSVDREEYAARIADTVLRRIGWGPRRRAAVRDVILATRADARPVTLEQRLVRAADLAPLAAPYPVFRVNNALLHAEATLLSGAPVPAPEWRDGCTRNICGYLRQDVTVLDGPAGSAAAARWRARVRANLAAYLRDCP